MVDICKGCGKEIHSFLTGRKKIAGEYYCRECYYKELGEFIEKNPIGAPHVRRGR